MPRTRHAAQVLVEAALVLQRHRPEVSALAILDATLLPAAPLVRATVVRGRSREKHWLQPDSAFGELIRRAFATQLPASSGTSSSWDSELAWEHTLEQFAARYV